MNAIWESFQYECVRLGFSREAEKIPHTNFTHIVEKSLYIAIAYFYLTILRNKVRIVSQSQTKSSSPVELLTVLLN